jgi:O-acetyl-ADP-ribose deacetylase
MSELQREIEIISGKLIQICLGDSTKERVDAIVNAANSNLAQGGGVAGALVRRGGHIIQAESDQFIFTNGPVPTGQVATTGAGRLLCQSVIHAVGPVWEGGTKNEPFLLASAIGNSLLKATQMNYSSIAIPAISSGIVGFPRELCAEICIKSSSKFYFEQSDSSREIIRFTVLDRSTLDFFIEAAKNLLI